MKNVLLINSGRKAVGCALQERDDILLSVISMPGYLDWYDAGTDLEVVDTIENLDLVRAAALRIRERNPFDYVVAPSEWSVPAGGFIRSYFGIPGPSFDVANAFSNKFVMKQKVAAAGLPVARFRRVNTLGQLVAVGDELGWPYVLKSAFGGGSENVFVVRDTEHAKSIMAGETLARLSDLDSPMLAEEFVDIDTEFHCDGVVVDGKAVFAAASRYLAPVLDSLGGVIGSYTLPDDHADARLICDLHDRVVTALGLPDGVTHLEVLKSSRGYLVGEIACRTAGGGIPLQLEHQYGVDTTDALIATSIGDPVELDVPSRSDYMIQYMLPRPVGTVTAISAAADLRSAAGVEYVEISTKVGDHLAGPVDSSVYAGIVLIRAATEAQVAERCAEIARRYRIDVAAEPVDDSATAVLAETRG
ncbi:ATP-grasp domain-containing protein [Micromonospora zamorensis]|uniref:ATP-grasp domain-containing protein n=1 Tax=Micromonospora zamorensis TaxID=709883 RepID=UPI00081FA055|nr:ATP-grasp domain-containing protein [Micromonospora zamorensis]SCG46258.1 ATP-grasp domain-containing protein [Micromonospora zamorensis]